MKLTALSRVGRQLGIAVDSLPTRNKQAEFDAGQRFRLTLAQVPTIR
jgi:hypothetical protein